MDPKQIGEQISTARKNLQYTQKELAQRLGVSDKTVSKWERAVGCPDISLLIPLCDELHIEVSQLLGKVPEGNETNQTKEELHVRQLAEYAKMKIIEKKEMILKVLTILVALGCWLAIGICLLVDYVMTNSFSWSKIAVASIFYGWIISSTFLMSKRGRIEKTLIISCVLVFPLLLVIAQEPTFQQYFPKGYVIAVGAVIFTGLLYVVILKLHFSIWFRLAIIVLLSLIFNLLINVYVETPMMENIFQVVSNVLIVFILCVIGFIKYRFQEE